MFGGSVSASPRATPLRNLWPAEADLGPERSMDDHSAEAPRAMMAVLTANVRCRKDWR